MARSGNGLRMWVELGLEDIRSYGSNTMFNNTRRERNREICIVIQKIPFTIGLYSYIYTYDLYNIRKGEGALACNPGCIITVDTYYLAKNKYNKLIIGEPNACYDFFMHKMGNVFCQAIFA